MQIRTPRIGAICSADDTDIDSLAWDFAYELRQFVKTDRNPNRRQAALNALAQYKAAGQRAQDLRAFVDGAGVEALQSYCLPFMLFACSPQGDYGYWPDLASLHEAIGAKDGVARVSAGDAWPPLWTPAGRGIAFIMEVNDHGNVTLYDRKRRELWSCV